MAIKLFIDNDYSDIIFSDIVNKQHKTLILTSNMIKVASLANRVHAETTRIFGDKYKKIITSNSISVNTPISKLFFTIPSDGEMICGTRVYSIIVDDFTHIDKDFLTDVLAGYCAVNTQPATGFSNIDITFYTNDVTNMKIYEWLSDNSSGH